MRTRGPVSGSPREWRPAVEWMPASNGLGVGVFAHPEDEGRV